MSNKVYDNEVRINITNFHMAKVSESEEGTLVFGAPERIVGAESAGNKASVAQAKLYGDGVVRKQHSKKTGFDLNIAHNGLPREWKSYLEGTQISEQGIESASSSDKPGFVAIGWEVEKTGGYSDFIWWPYCQAEPIEESTEQTEDGVNYSTDKINFIAMEHPSIKRYYVRCDTELEKNKAVTAEQWFSKVQTTDAVEDGTAGVGG